MTTINHITGDLVAAPATTVAARPPLFMMENLDEVDLLLVSCLRVDLESRARLEALAEMCRGFSAWPLLVARAGQQGVIGWAHEALSMAGAGLVPDGVMADLRRTRIGLTAGIATATRDLGEVINVLNSVGVRHIVLKGPFLADHVYPRPGLRYYTDIDLLVHENDVGRAGEVICELGYRLVEDEEERGFFAEGKTQVHFYRQRRMPLDLHWELVNLPSHLPSVNVDLEAIWDAAGPVTIAGAETMALPPEDCLLFQCIHMSVHHEFNRLLWCKDVEQVAWRYGAGFDWDLFVEKCDFYGLKTFVYYSLLMTADVCGVPVASQWVLDALRPRYMMARLFERLAHGANVLQMQERRRRPAIEVWKLMRDDRRRRWQAVAGRLFPEVGWYLECYPFLPKAKHQNLYYAIYPALMLLRSIKKPIQLE